MFLLPLLVFSATFLATQDSPITEMTDFLNFPQTFFSDFFVNCDQVARSNAPEDFALS